MAAFPAAKLGALILKQVSKPVANACKNYAKSAPFFRKYICMPPAQLYHWSEVKMKMWILNLGKPVNIPVLNEQQAIELGANLLGEGVIFAIAALILISEYNRSAAKEAKKEAAIKEEKLRLEQSLHELYFTTQKQATQINELIRLVYDMESKVIQVPWKSGKKPSSTLLDADDEPTERPPPPPPTGGATTPTDHFNHKPDQVPPKSKAGPTECSIRKHKSHQLRKPNSSLLGCAYEFVENDLFAEQERNTSIVNLGIHHLYTNVYRIPVST